MPIDQPHPVKLWSGVVLFFGIGSAIAGGIAFAHVRDGGTVAGGIAIGACVGGVGAWIIFLAGYRFIRALKRLIRWANA